jgi:hypothetical protein
MDAVRSGRRLQYRLDQAHTDLPPLILTATVHLIS